jgi:hypothetical protein
MLRNASLAVVIAGLFALAVFPRLSRAADETATIRLYAFDGGYIDIPDMGMFSDRIVKNTHARFVTQHSIEDFATLPKVPQYIQ